MLHSKISGRSPTTTFGDDILFYNNPLFYPHIFKNLPSENTKTVKKHLTKSFFFFV